MDEDLFYVFLFQLEEGEIDVRLNSLKGCFIQRSGRTRNWLKKYLVSSLILSAKKVYKIHCKIKFLIMVRRFIKYQSQDPTR